MKQVALLNDNKDESELWKTQLTRSGYTVVGTCANLSEFVYVLSKMRVQVVMCSANALGKNAYAVLKSIFCFFAGIKLVIIGEPAQIPQLSDFTDIYIKRVFDTNIGDCFKPPVRLSPYETAKKTEYALNLLLSDHFLQKTEAESVLKAALPHWKTGYAVICVKTNITSHSYIFSVLSRMKHIERKGFLTSYATGLFCIVLHDNPRNCHVLEFADSLRRELLSKTDARFSIGISRTRDAVYSLYVCRREAERAAEATFLYGQNSVIHIDYIDTKDFLYAYPDHKEKRLIEQTMQGNVSEALRMLKEIFLILSERPYVHLDLVNKIALTIIVKLNAAAGLRVKSFEKTQTDSFAVGKLSSAKTAEEVYAFLQEGIRQFASEMEAIIDISREVQFLKLMKLLSENQDISITDLSVKYNTTVNYLNTTIQNNSGHTIFELFKSNENLT